MAKKDTPLRFQDVKQILQLDRTLGYALASRIWQSGAGLVTAWFLVHLTLPEMGVYYTLVQIVGIQAWFELGLLNVLVSYSGHAMASVVQEQSLESARRAETEASSMGAARAKMHDLVVASGRWFGKAAVLYSVIAIVLGFWTLSESTIRWAGPLLAVVPLAAMSVAMSPYVAILEGAGFRDVVQRLRFVQAVLGSLAVWLTLALGFGVWAIVIASAVQTVMTLLMIKRSCASFFLTVASSAGQPSAFQWSRDILPTQWRMAAISVTFHIATQCFVIIVTMYHGDAAAGPLGMTLSMSSAIQMLALAWLQSQFPEAARLHAAGDREKAGIRWRRTAVVSTLILAVGFCALCLGVVLLSFLAGSYEKRFLPPWQILLLGLGCLSNHITSVQGYYVLARKAKPMLIPSLIGSITTAIVVWSGGYLYSVTGIIVGYACTMTLIFLPVHSLAYLRFRRDSS